MADIPQGGSTSRRDRKIEERRSKLQQQASANKASGLPPGRRKKRKPVNRKWAIRIAAAVIVLIFAIVIISRIVDRIQSSTDIILTDEGFKHSDKFANCAVLQGIDVSAHNSGDIKWKKVKSSGVDFAFIRAGYRAADDGTLHIDETFEKNVKGAAKAGIMTGAYFYSQALTPQEAQEEAYFLLELVKKKDITMPLAIDFEIYEGGRLDQKIQAGELYAASLYHDIVLAFCNAVHEAGYESAIYANRDMLTNYMQADLLDDSATIWLARYNKKAGLDADYMFWQCSDEGVVGGIEGNVDHDFWYVEPNKVYKTRAAGVKEKRRISIGNCRVAFQRSVTKLKRGRANPKLGITYEGKGLKEGRDYILTVVRNTQPGTGYIMIRGIGLYKNWMMVPFEIE
ncbi:MAG: glycoside hydrolase family 25 protein [Mogibacterium sp.]|nr:glycoside hydrolase family 25 protein [Mogibacterium sp.]